MIRWLFHIGCAIVLATSLLFFAQGDAARPSAPEAREQLFRFMKAQGLEQSTAQEILGGETLYIFKGPHCATRVTVIYMPVIHRISDVAHELFRRDTSVFVHDGLVVPNLDAGTLVPRWLWRRVLVNLQAAAEDPWISIGLAIQDPGGCLTRTLDWTQLRRS